MEGIEFSRDILALLHISIVGKVNLKPPLLVSFTEINWIAFFLTSSLDKVSFFISERWSALRVTSGLGSKDRANLSSGNLFEAKLE